MVDGFWLGTELRVANEMVHYSEQIFVLKVVEFEMSSGWENQPQCLYKTSSPVDVSPTVYALLLPFCVCNVKKFLESSFRRSTSSDSLLVLFFVFYRKMPGEIRISLLAS